MPLACPECGGALWLAKDGLPRYRCHVGHGFTAENLLADQADASERALWAALRNLEERGDLLTAMAARAKEAGRHFSATTLGKRAAETAGHIDALRQLLLTSYGPPKTAPES